MSPLSGPVLTGATIVASPALWAGLVDQTMPLDVALTRYLIAVVISWVVLSIVAELAFPTPGAKPQPAEALETTPSASEDHPQAG
ncbi:MAG: hypothetical protein ACJ72E_04195 [Marmoricola sp.]